MIQSETVRPEFYFYRKCYQERQATNPECPQCGRKMQTRSQIKSLGLILIILGILISLGFGLGVLIVIAVLFFGKLNDKDVAIAFCALALTGVGLAMGITVIVGGAWQKKHGRTSKMFALIFLGLVVLMLVVSGIFSVLKD